MVCSKLVQIVEDHSEQISARVMREIQKSPKLTHLKRLPEFELRQRAHDILRNLGHWLVASNEEELTAYYEHLGRFRCQEGIPLEEVLLAYLVVKEEMLEFVRDMGMGQSTVELYAEEELQHCVGRFFDHVIYHLTRGYQHEMLGSLSHAAAAGPPGKH